MEVRGMEGWLRIACAVILLSVAFAHKPVEAGPQPSPGLNYALIDGVFAGQLCINGAEDGAPRVPAWHGCDACVIASGVILPPPPLDYLPAASDYAAIEFVVDVWIDLSPPLRPGSPVRGPPALFA